MIRVGNILEEGRLGGPQKRVALIAKRLEKIGVQTTVVFPTWSSSDFAKLLTKYEIPFIQRPIQRLSRQSSGNFKYCMYFIEEILKLCRIFRALECDIVHISGGAWQFKGLLAGKLAGKKTIWHLNDSYMPLAIRLIFEVIGRLFPPDGYIVSCERTKGYYFKQRRFAKHVPIKTIFPPVDTNCFMPGKVAPDPRIAFLTGPKIITVANINPIKGLEYFILMAREISYKLPQSKFIIIGRELDSKMSYARYLDDLKRKYSLDNLSFFGPVKDVRAVLEAADIFVCSSLAETGPMTLFEAMSMAKAVVSTDVGDVGSMIKDGENGFVVRVKDVRNMAKCVVELIEQPSLRKSLGDKARNYAVRYLDIHNTVKRHTEFYNLILKVEKSVNVSQVEQI